MQITPPSIQNISASGANYEQNKTNSKPNNYRGG